MFTNHPQQQYVIVSVSFCGVRVRVRVYVCVCVVCSPNKLTSTVATKPCLTPTAHFICPFQCWCNADMLKSNGNKALCLRLF